MKNIFKDVDHMTFFKVLFLPVLGLYFFLGFAQRLIEPINIKGGPILSLIGFIINTIELVLELILAACSILVSWIYE